ncbi:MBL fold metallo-hydrolase [Candidatus Woesearchaeota archaeon]|nr:MBL fold metallo-hydrolase [Candidatus Woesearchaeota archaeon]
MKVTITFNNESNPGFKSGWGFSCLVNESMLFDTGCSFSDLFFNMKKLNINLRKIKKIVLSHEHWDHIGGLFDLLNYLDKVKVYALKSFSKAKKSEISKRADLVLIDKKKEISKDIFTTGELGTGIKEQSLISKTSKGNIVICGCAHPGVRTILEKARHFGEIYGIIGGLHGFSDYSLIKNIKLIAACHCTQNIKELQERFPKQFSEVKTGDIIEIN